MSYNAQTPTNTSTHTNIGGNALPGTLTSTYNSCIHTQKHMHTHTHTHTHTQTQTQTDTHTHTHTHK